jgi:phosphonopyruvate decarboxylase
VPLDPQRLFSALLDAGITGLAGVPCSILNHLILEAEASEAIDYLAASNEGEAVSAAAGTWLAGGLGAALMQNSGLGNAVNPLASLLAPYDIPVLMIVSWRGEPGRKDAVHHAPMGEATPGLFELFGVPVTTLREDTDLDKAVGAAVAHMKATRKPAALIVPRGLFAKSGDDAVARSAPVLDGDPGKLVSQDAIRAFEGGALPSRTEVLDAFLARFPEDLAISTTGYMSRELAAHAQIDRHFPMQGSMGFAPAIALGLSRATDKRLFVLDGDGALIMHLGSLATIGALAPKRLIHIVIDNGTYASTGGQRSMSPYVDFSRVALACGYAAAGRCRGADGLADALAWAGETTGPVLLHVAVDEREASGLERPDATPQEIAAAFRSGVTGGGQ